MNYRGTKEMVLKRKTLPWPPSQCPFPPCSTAAILPCRRRCEGRALSPHSLQLSLSGSRGWCAPQGKARDIFMAVHLLLGTLGLLRCLCTPASRGASAGHSMHLSGGAEVGKRNMATSGGTWSLVLRQLCVAPLEGKNTQEERMK